MAGIYQRLRQRPRCIAGAHIELVGHGHTGRETHGGIIPPCLAPGVGVKMNGRVPAASHTDGIAYQVALLTGGFVTDHLAYNQPAHRQTTFGFNGYKSAQNLDPCHLRLLDKAAHHGVSAARINNGDMCSSLLEGQRI